MGKLIVILLGVMRSILINFKIFPIKIALKLPLLISPFVKIKSLKGKILIKNSEIKFGMIKIGFGEVGIFDEVFSRTILQINGKMIFNGKASISHGSRISIGTTGELEIGKNFNITAETTIVCHNYIKFGDDNLISWGNLFLDTDFHKIIRENKKEDKNKNIIIGNNVWIGCRNTFLKGSRVSDNSVIGASSLLNKEFIKTNVLIAGNPAKIIEENIKWEN